jgi:hypothetical protein
MVTHNVTMNVESGSYVTLVAEPIFIKRSGELAPALRQHERPVVIDDEQISAKFRRLGYWENKRQTFLLGWIAALLAALLAYAISQQYGIDAGWNAKWSQVEFEGKIKLTPKP